MNNEFNLLGGSYDSLHNLCDAQSVESIIIDGFSTVTQLGFAIVPTVSLYKKYCTYPVFAVASIVTACISYAIYNLYSEDIKYESTDLVPQMPTIQNLPMHLSIYSMKLYHINLNHCMYQIYQPMQPIASNVPAVPKFEKAIQLTSDKYALVLANCTLEQRAVHDERLQVEQALQAEWNKKMTFNEAILFGIFQDYSMLELMLDRLDTLKAQSEDCI